MVRLQWHTAAKKEYCICRLETHFTQMKYRPCSSPCLLDTTRMPYDHSCTDCGDTACPIDTCRRMRRNFELSTREYTSISLCLLPCKSRISRIASIRSWTPPTSPTLASDLASILKPGLDPGPTGRPPDQARGRWSEGWSSPCCWN